MNIIELADSRYATKAYNPTKKIPADQLEQLYHFLRNCPSSVNAQPWHFVVISTDEAKQRILPGIMEPNHHKIQDASHIVIFCARTEINSEYLNAVLHREAADGRYATEKQAEETDGTRRYFINHNSSTPQDLVNWTSKQAYLALGGLLFAATLLGIDSTPIEGFDPANLDKILGLSDKGLTSVVIASLGYRSPSDFNAELPKSRLPDKDLFTFL